MAESTIRSSGSSNQDFGAEDELEITIKRHGMIFSLLHDIYIIIAIFLYPLIWIARMIYRSWRFLGGGKKYRNNPLNYQEIAFLETYPFFLILFALVFPIFIGIYAWADLNKRIGNTVGSFSQGTTGIENLGSSFLGAIYGIIDFFANTFNQIFVFISTENTFILSLLAAIAFIIGLAYLFFTESGIIQRFIFALEVIGLGLTDIPRNIYNFLDYQWMKVTRRVGRTIMGGKIIATHSRGFYQKIVWLTLIYAFLAIIWGTFLLLNELKVSNNTFININDPTKANIILGAIVYLIYMFLAIAILSGIILVIGSIKIIRLISKDKYIVEQRKINVARHQALVRYILQHNPKSPVLPFDHLSLRVDIPVSEFNKHWTDKRLSDWQIYKNHIVNKVLFDQGMSRVDVYHSRGLEKNKMEPIIKAIDYLSYIHNKFGSVPELNDLITIKRDQLLQNLAVIRGAVPIGTNKEQKG